MRKKQRGLDKPSTRQGINISKLLINKYLKNGFLLFDDFLCISIVTSKLDCQKIAEKTAIEILLDHEVKKKEENDYTDNEFLSIFSTINEKLTYVTPHGIGLENDYTPYHDSDIDVFTSHENEPNLGVGPGENEIIKKVVKATIKEKDVNKRKLFTKFLIKILLNMGNELERRLEWSRSSVVRPFQPGEDPENIDEEKSLENILDLGRSIDEIRHSDFLMHKKKKTDRTIFYVIDISNTMFYEYEGLNSISYSILCLIPLLWTFRHDKFSILLYESNTHIMKDFYDDFSVENLIDDLLKMLESTTRDIEKRFSGHHGSMTWGGTVPNSSLRYTYDSLTDFNHKKEKICFIFSDFVLSEPGKESSELLENYDILKKIISDEVKVIGCVSPLASEPIFSPYSNDVLKTLDKIGVKLTETSKITKFLYDIQEIITETCF
jgi:hypothetical protein